MGVRRLAAGGGAEHPGSRVFVFDFPDTVNVDSLRIVLEAQPWVEYAEFDRLMELYAVPDDPLFSRQWALENTGQLIPTVVRLPGYFNDTLAWVSGTPGADVDFLSADAHPGPRSTVIVGVLDTGSDPLHPDLAGHLWHNPGEIPTNGLDDDHNGYADDDLGYDFSGDVAQMPNTLVPDPDPTDSIGHGTHVAGIIAAITDNGLGISGVAPAARIMTLKVFPNAFNSVIARAIYYAVDNGAQILNMSFGSPFPSKTVADALAYARSQGLLPVVAAGNDGAEAVNYPAADTAVLCVGALNYLGRVTTFSTMGSYLDLVAPGEAILSLRAAGTDMYAENGEPDVHILNEHYYLADGTSMASPYAAGCAAAVLSIEGGLTPNRLVDILTRSCVDLVDPYGTGASYPGWDKYSGYGAVNLGRALNELAGVTVGIDSPQEGEVHSGMVAITGTVAGSNFTGYDLRYGLGASPSTWTTLVSSTQPLVHDTLFVWNTAGLTGTVTLRLQAAAGHHDDVTFLVANGTISKIISPRNGDTISLVETIVGTSVAPDFTSANVSFAPADDQANSTTIWTGTRPVVDDSLCIWSVDAPLKGWFDLMLTTSTQSGTLTDSVRVCIKNPFHPGWPVRLPAYAFYAPAAADLDGDHKIEFVVPTSRGLYVLEDDGALAPGWPRDTLINFQSIPAIADLDQDGLLEIITAADDYLHVYSFFGAPYGFWPKEFAGRPNLFGVAVPTVCDLDGSYERDGFPEIVVIDFAGIVHAFRDDGSEYQFPAAAGPLVVDAFYTASGSVPHVAVIDAARPGGSGRDGDNELIVAADGVWIWNAKTGAPFNGSTAQIRDYRATYGIAVANFDADDQLEIAVAYTPHGSNTFYLEILNADGTPLPGWPVSTGLTDELYLVNSLSAGDVDKDGLPEVFLAPYSLGKGYILAYRPDGTPLLPQNGNGVFLELFGSSSPVSLTDVTGDGRPEVLTKVGEFFFGDEYLYALTADGEFAPGYPLRFGYGIGTQLAAPLTTDLDGDGYMNMLTLESSGRVATAWDFPDRFTVAGHPWPKFGRDNWNSGVIPSFVHYDLSYQVYLVKLINYMFHSVKMYFPPYQIPDADCDGRVSIADLVIIVNFIYRLGPMPCAP